MKPTLWILFLKLLKFLQFEHFCVWSFVVQTFHINILSNWKKKQTLILNLRQKSDNKTVNLQRSYHQPTDYNFIFESTIIIFPWSLLRRQRPLILSVHEAHKPLRISTVLWKIFIQIVMTMRATLIKLTCECWVDIIRSGETEVRKVLSSCIKTFLYLRQR